MFSFCIIWSKASFRTKAMILLEDPRVDILATGTSKQLQKMENSKIGFKNIFVSNLNSKTCFNTFFDVFDHTFYS